MAKKPSETTALEDMFEHALKDMYYAEKKIYSSLPKVIKAAQSEDLKAALSAHREETAGHIQQLENIFGMIGKTPKAQKCDAIDGILKEVEGVIEDFGDTSGCDAAIIFAGQAVEHYEITRYGTMRVWAETMGKSDIEVLLADLRDEERAADEKMTALAEGQFNHDAHQKENA
jgi:ferritin-like metal-binding protein YciE